MRCDSCGTCMNADAGEYITEAQPVANDFEIVYVKHYRCYECGHKQDNIETIIVETDTIH